MRIKKLLIKNLGKHQHLEATLDGSVVGLLGVNGSGKSTILKLIHFLMTGWTPARETQESFIRRVDPDIEMEPACGLAEMVFSAQGNDYLLRRQIGSPSSRKLAKLDSKGKEIKAETYTGAGEIQDMLTDILGADKYAIDNAVFPEQGGLDKILFGSQAEREELLVKLLLLGHMQKVADVAAGKIKVLSAEIQDFSALHDELQAARNTAEQELASAEEQLTRTKSYSDEIALYSDWESTTNDINTAAAHALSAKNNARFNDDRAQVSLKEQGEKLRMTFSTPEDLGDWLDNLKMRIKSAHDDVAHLQDKKNKATQYRSIVERVQKYTYDLTQLKADCPAPIEPHIIPELQRRIENQSNRDFYKKQVEEATAQGKVAREKIELLEDLIKTLTSDSEKLKKEEQDLLNERSLFKTITDTCKLALANNCTADCPVCGENVSHEKLRLRFSEYNDKLSENLIKLNEATTKLERANKQLREAQHEHTQRQTLLNVCINQYKTNKALLDAGKDEDVEALKQELSRLNFAQAKRSSDIKSIEKLEFEIKTLEFALEGFTPAEIESFQKLDLNSLDKELGELKEKIEHWNSRLDDLSKSYLNIRHFISARDTETKRSEEFAEQCRNLSLRRDAIFDSFPPQLKYLVEQGGEIKDSLLEKYRIYNQLEAKAAQLKIQANNVKKRLQEIESKIKLDEDKRAVIAELQRVVHAFSRQGIPMAYVQHKFDSLISMTQDNLEIMDANFAIIPHPNKPVSLQFYRVDEPGHVLFDHDKLSGGQRVRLSIAFLLAVQQLVIPELGFLVLDEPSTHLDDESKENLKELLLNLNQQLESTDTQILVCDHARELEPAFVNVIQL